MHMILQLRRREVSDFLYNRQPGEFFELKTPFTPKPIIDMDGAKSL